MARKEFELGSVHVIAIESTKMVYLKWMFTDSFTFKLLEILVMGVTNGK